MKILRFLADNQPPRYGVVQERQVRELAGAPYNGIKFGPRSYQLEEITLLPPCEPSKIVAVGVNYRAHAKEMGRPLPAEPLLFLKPVSALIGSGAEIHYPPNVTRVDHEAELAIVIKKRIKSITSAQAADAILGYTCLNDVTARDLQHRDLQWTRAKAFDTFAPLGPWIVTDLDPSKLKIEAILNGQVKQSESTADMIFPAPFLVSFISSIMTLFPGDVITTGTPPGVSPMQRGDTIEIVIEGIGTLTNTVR